MTTHYDFINIGGEVIIRILSLVQLGLTIFYCYLWGKMRTNLALEKYNKSEEEDDGIYLSPY